MLHYYIVLISLDFDKCNKYYKLFILLYLMIRIFKVLFDFIPMKNIIFSKILKHREIFI